MNQTGKPHFSEMHWSSTIECSCCKAVYDVTQDDLLFMYNYSPPEKTEIIRNEGLYLPQCTVCREWLDFNSPEEKAAVPCGAVNMARRRYLGLDKIPETYSGGDCVPVEKGTGPLGLADVLAFIVLVISTGLIVFGIGLLIRALI
jgi:hypothetical protein